MSPKGALTGQKGPDGRMVAGQGHGLCSWSQTLSFASPLAGMASSLVGPARVPMGLTILESPSEERDLGYILGGGGRTVGDSLPAWAMASWAPGVRREKDKGKRGFNRV